MLCGTTSNARRPLCKCVSIPFLGLVLLGHLFLNIFLVIYRYLFLYTRIRCSGLLRAQTAFFLFVASCKPDLVETMTHLIKKRRIEKGKQKLTPLSKAVVGGCSRYGRERLPSKRFGPDMTTSESEIPEVRHYDALRRISAGQDESHFLFCKRPFNLLVQ